MKTFIRALGLILASLSAQAGALAQPSPLPSEDSIRPFIDRADWYEAATRINRLVEAHIAAGAEGRADPVIDRLMGALLASYSPKIARILLERASTDPTTRDRGRYLMLLAEANETIGDTARAEEIYRRILAGNEFSTAHRVAALGLARLLLVTRPREALTVATDLVARETDPAERWEGELIAARAARILGLRSESTNILEQASSHAWSAPQGDSAVSRIALDRAVVAGLAGDRAALMAMSALVGGSQRSTANHFAQLLPECGRQGIAAEDFVIVEMVPRGNAHPRLGLIYASRPGIAAPFLELASRAPLGEFHRQAMSLLLRCTSAPRIGATQPWDDPVLEWAAARGAYPVLESSEPGRASHDLTKLMDQASSLSADSLFLAPVLVRLLSSPSEAPAEAPSSDVERRLDYVRRLNRLLVAHGAPPDARLPAALAQTILTALSVQQTQQASVRALRATLEASAADPALTTDSLLIMAEFVPPEAAAEVPGLKIALLNQALERMHRPGGASDVRMRGVAMRLINLQREAGNEAEALRLERDFAIAPDLCGIAEQPPRYLSAEIRTEDYPADAVAGQLFGSVTLDLALDSHGALTSVRQVISTPPFVFDDAMAARAHTIRYEPAHLSGRARACRGLTQGVGWQLP